MAGGHTWLGVGERVWQGGMCGRGCAWPGDGGMHGQGVCVWLGVVHGKGGMHGEEGCVWQRGACVAKVGGMCGKGGGHVWQRGGMCGKGAWHAW